MALSTNAVWEIRPTNGSDNNGGAFVAGATGTDYSQQNAAQVVIDNSTITATSVTTTLTFVSGYTPSAADVGNHVNLTAGTGVTTGVYQITAMNVGAKTWTLDRSAGATGSAIVGNMGGAMKTIPAAMAQVSGNGVSGNKFYVKAEAAISTTATITLNAPLISPAASGMPNRLIGYTTTRTDAGQVTIQLATNSGLTVLNITTRGWIVENFVLDCSSLGTSTGIGCNQNGVTVRNVKVKNFTTAGVSMTADQVIVENCEITAGTSAATQALLLSGGAGGFAVRCNIHDNACTGIIVTTGLASVIQCLITNNTGATSDGIQWGGANSVAIYGNTIYGSGRHGINNTASTGFLRASISRNNLIAKSGQSGTGYGQVFASIQGFPADSIWDGNAYWSNATGNRNNGDDTTTNPINNVSPYTNVLDVICTQDPFVNDAGGDFTLNNNAGGGVLVRGFGVPGSIQGTTKTSSQDMGVFQHVGASGGWY